MHLAKLAQFVNMFDGIILTLDKKKETTGPPPRQLLDETVHRANASICSEQINPKIDDRNTDAIGVGTGRQMCWRDSF